MMTKESVKTWIENFKSVHQRLMMRFLRKRGWVVFYLEDQARKCNGVCWLDLYKSDQEYNIGQNKVGPCQKQ